MSIMYHLFGHPETVYTDEMLSLANALFREYHQERA